MALFLSEYEDTESIRNSGLIIIKNRVLRSCQDKNYEDYREVI